MSHEHRTPAGSHPFFGRCGVGIRQEVSTLVIITPRRRDRQIAGGDMGCLTISGAIAARGTIGVDHPDRWPRTSVIALFTLMLGGCAIAQVGAKPEPGAAQVRVARLASGEGAVYLYRITRWHVVTQEIASAQSLVLHPGKYVVRVVCNRPGAVITVGDDSSNFQFSVQAGHRYVLDCRPTSPGVNNYFISDTSH